MKRHTLDAMNVLRTAFQDDPGYANGWHDNIACAAMDEGVSHAVANLIAARFMRHAFGVQTGTHAGAKPEEWPDIIQ